MPRRQNKRNLWDWVTAFRDLVAITAGIIFIVFAFMTNARSAESFELEKAAVTAGIETAKDIREVADTALRIEIIILNILNNTI